MPTRKYTFDFYGTSYASSNAEAPARTLGDRLHDIHELKNARQPYYKEIGSLTYEVRELVPTEYGFKGVVGKHRHIDLPPAAFVGGDERELELDEGENILEKSHFQYHADMGVIVVQRNVMCIGHTKLAILFAEAGYTCALNPVVNPADLRKLAQGNMMLKHAKISIARPTNPALFQGLEHDFNNTIFQSMDQTGSAKLNAEFRGDGRSRDPERRYLDPRIKRAFRELTATFDVDRCDILLEDIDTGMTHPIDLVADRVLAVKQVETVGRNATTVDIFHAMEEAKLEQQDRLEQYFGVPGEPRIQ